MNIDELTKYDNLKDDAKEILNCAMDVYWYIKDIEIKRMVKDLYNSEEVHIFTKADKKVISLYLAFFLADTNLKKKMNEYKDINEKSILSFLGIEKKNIKTLYYESYKPFYEMSFKSILKDMIQKKQKNFESKKIDCKSIYLLMRNIKISNSDILNYLARCYTSEKFLCKHPSFEEVRKDDLLHENDNQMEEKKLSDYDFWFDRSYRHFK